MLDFFIALFGGLSLGKKIVSDNISKSISNKSTEYNNKLNERIKQRVEATNDLEQEIKERLLCGDYADEIYDELYDDLVFVFGSADLNRVFPLPRFRYNSIGDLRSPTYWAYQLLLAHRGKVSWQAYMHGFPIGGMDMKDKNIKLCHWIEYNLQQNNTDIRLYMQPGIRDDNLKWNPCGKYIVLENNLICETNRERARLW